MYKELCLEPVNHNGYALKCVKDLSMITNNKENTMDRLANMDSCVIEYKDNLSGNMTIRDKSNNKVEIAGNDIIEFVGNVIKEKKLAEINKTSASSILGL